MFFQSTVFSVLRLKFHFPVIVITQPQKSNKKKLILLQVQVTFRLCVQIRTLYHAQQTHFLHDVSESLHGGDVYLQYLLSLYHPGLNNLHCALMLIMLFMGKIFP